MFNKNLYANKSIFEQLIDYYIVLLDKFCNIIYNIKNFIINIFFPNILNTNIINENWIIFYNLINIVLISFFIIILGILLPNKAKIIKFLNLISAFYLLIFFYLISIDHIYHIKNITLIFQQNYTLTTNLFFFIATLTTILFFLSISDIFYLEENTKIEYTLIVIFIYIAALLLINSLDFISIIILLECISFSSYVLVGFERKNKFSASSALKYLILASIPSGIFILGVSLLYHNYGSFYQDYLEILLISYDKFSIINLDWYYIQDYYSKNLSNFYSNNNEEYVYTTFGAYYSIFLDELNLFLQINNPLILLDLIDLEKLMCILFFKETSAEASWISILTVDDITSFITNKNLCEDLYIELYTKYLYITMWLTFLYQLHDQLYLLHNFVTPEHSYNIIDNFYIFLSEDYSNILDWYSFLSYYKFKIENINADHAKNIINSFFCIDIFQKGNINYLENIVFNNIFYLFNINDFNLHLQYLEKAFNLLNLYEYFEFFFNKLSSKIDTLLYITWATNILEIISTNYENNIFTNLAEDNIKPLIQKTIIDLFTYNNIFLSLYLVIIFIIMNLSFKITAAPFHFWAPTIYGGSPLPTVTFLSIFSKLTIIFLFINIFINLFDNLKNIWQPIIYILGLFSVIISILGAFSEKLFKRFFVYSSIGHIGFILLGIAALNYEGLIGTIDYLIVYIISSFIVWIIIMFLTKKTTHLINFKGLSYNYPTLSFILVITLFSISGLPPMAGFFVKFEIFYSLLNSSQYFIAYILFLLTVFSFFYYLRLIKIIYFEDNKKIKKIKNINDIKLRLISVLVFFLIFYIILIQEPIYYILKHILIN